MVLPDAQAGASRRRQSGDPGKAGTHPAEAEEEFLIPGHAQWLLASLSTAIELRDLVKKAGRVTLISLAVLLILLVAAGFAFNWMAGQS